LKLETHYNRCQSSSYTYIDTDSMEEFSRYIQALCSDSAFLQVGRMRIEIEGILQEGNIHSNLGAHPPPPTLGTKPSYLFAVHITVAANVQFLHQKDSFSRYSNNKS
jgi:hypothetical protein